MPLTPNAFALHDNSKIDVSTSPDLIPARPRRSTRSGSKLAFRLPSTDAKGMADGGHSNRKAKPTRRRNAPSNHIDSDADDDYVSPTVLAHNGHSHPTATVPKRSRYKKAHPNSKSKDLAVDIAAANEAFWKGPTLTNSKAVGAVKAHEIDWEIPRKLLHSSIGK